MNGRRGLLAAVTGCLGGVALTLFAAGRPWATAGAHLSPLPPVHLTLTGGDLAGAVWGLGVATLAVPAALVATRGWQRRLIGVLTCLLGTAIAASAIGATRGGHVRAVAAERSSLLHGVDAVVVSATAWWLAALAGGLVIVAVGVFIGVASRDWPAMSRRYERVSPPAGAPTTDDPRLLWDALDRGSDPTDPA